MQDCIFCKIINGTLLAEVIKETDDLLVIKDIQPKAPIHYLIISKEHYQDLQAIPSKKCCLLAGMLKMAQELGVATNDYKIVLNNGHAAGQRVFHAHMHFLSGAQKVDI
jgi:histidine triad (HIT) family protein